MLLHCEINLYESSNKIPHVKISVDNGFIACKLVDRHYDQRILCDIGECTLLDIIKRYRVISESVSVSRLISKELHYGR